jgi:lysozyme
MTEVEASELLIKTLVEFENKVNSLGLPLKQNEFDALVSFSYNLGFGALKGSTLLKRVLSQKGDITEAFLM